MEIQSANMTLIKVVQQYAFTKELRILNNINSGAKTGVSMKGHLLALNPFIDKDGVLRVGGRLLNASDISYEQKQIILNYITAHRTFFVIIFSTRA